MTCLIHILIHCKNSTSTKPKIIWRFRGVFFGQFDDDQNRWQHFFFFFYPRVNLKTTFPVHKSSFCVRILLPPELHALSSFSALLLTLLLIRFMGDKSGGASAKAAPTSSSCRHTKTHSIYIRTVSSTALISHKSYYEKSKKKSRERLLLFSTKTQSIYYGTVSS